MLEERYLPRVNSRGQASQKSNSPGKKSKTKKNNFKEVTASKTSFKKGKPSELSLGLKIAGGSAEFDNESFSNSIQDLKKLQKDRTQNSSRKRGNKAVLPKIDLAEVSIS